MGKQQSTSGNKQSAADRDQRSPKSKPANSGKGAASHTKAGRSEGAGGGAKQARKH